MDFALWHAHVVKPLQFPSSGGCIQTARGERQRNPQILPRAAGLSGAHQLSRQNRSALRSGVNNPGTAFLSPGTFLWHCYVISTDTELWLSMHFVPRLFLHTQACFPNHNCDHGFHKVFHEHTGELWTQLEAPAPSTPKFLALSHQMESSTSSWPNV